MLEILLISNLRDNNKIEIADLKWKTPPFTVGSL